MIPIGDDNRGRRSFPTINYVLIAINVAVFLYELSLPSDQLQIFMLRYGAIPYQITHNVTHIPGLPASIQSPAPVYLTIFTAMFIHGGWLHIGGNMLYLWIFGDNVEDSMGHFRYLIFYLLGGVAAALTQTFVGGPNSVEPMIGASGAIAAVLAGYLILYPRGLVRTLIFFGFFFWIFMVPAIIVIGVWIIIQLFTGVASLGVATAQTGGVAVWAHVGGFALGAILIWLFRNPRAVERQRLARRGYRAFDRWGT